MKILIAFNFFLFALILIGLYFVSNTRYRMTHLSAKYWSWSIVLDAMGLVLMSAVFMAYQDFSDQTPLRTIFNTALFASLIYQALSMKALRTDHQASQHGFAWAMVLIFAIGWEYLRHNATVNQKLQIFGYIALVILLWQLYEITRDFQTKKSQQIIIVLCCVCAEIFFTGLRIFFSSEIATDIVNAEQLPMLGVVSAWLQYGFKIIAYAALVGYWSERLAIEKIQAEMEAQAFKTLSKRQEKLIADLGRLNKAATAGVLAASIAHELSQPLQSMLLNNSLALEEATKPNANMQLLESTLQEQIDSANRMTEIINTMRGVFTESGAKEQTVDLFDITERLGLLIKPQSEKRGIRVMFEKTGPALVKVRISEIQQVLLNLVGNAVDALIQSDTLTPTIKVSFGNESEWVTCHVEDNGPGIPQSKLENIFKFLNSSKTGGMGLGLWLSKYIIERNHGQIHVSASSMGGAKFTIQLPKAA